VPDAAAIARASAGLTAPPFVIGKTVAGAGAGMNWVRPLPLRSA
jgi:hypothetical protein